MGTSFWMAMYTVFVVSQHTIAVGTNTVMMTPKEYEQIQSMNFVEPNKEPTYVRTTSPLYKMEAPTWVVYYVRECKAGFIQNNEEFGKYPTTKQYYDLKQCNKNKWIYGTRNKYTDPNNQYGTQFPNEELVFDNNDVDPNTLNFR